MGLGCPQGTSVWVQAAGVQAARRETQVFAVGSECAVGSSENENGEGIRGQVNRSLIAAPENRRGKGAEFMQAEEEDIFIQLS